MLKSRLQAVNRLSNVCWDDYASYIDAGEMVNIKQVKTLELLTGESILEKCRRIDFVVCQVDRVSDARSMLQGKVNDYANYIDVEEMVNKYQ